MKPLKLFLAIVVFSLFALHPLAAFDKIPIAIMDFKVTNVDKNEFDLFLDFLSNALFETGVFDVLQRDKRDKLLQEIQFSMSDTADAKKTRQVGKLLSSKLLVFGNLGKVGKNVLLSVSLVDVETGRTVSTFSKTYKSLEEVFESLPVVSASLADTAAQSMFMKMTSVLYFDDFEQETWLVSDKLRYVNGKYHIFSKESSWYIWQEQTIDDFSIECEATYTQGAADGSFGIIYRLQDESNFYTFQISANGMCTVLKCIDKKYTAILPWTQYKAINNKAPNLLKITAFRNRFSAYINNVKIKEFTDQSFREGKFGLIASQATDAAFDNLVVYQGNLVFYDYFSKPSDNFLEAKIAYTKDGMYFIDGMTQTSEFFTWITEPRKNFSFKADAEFKGGDINSAYGIAVRILSAENNYSFYITKSGYYRFGYYKNYVWTSLVDWKKTRLFNPETRNILRVECVDDTFYLYLNENLIETVVDNTFREGGIGFMTASGVNAAFDNAELFLLDQP